MAKTLRTRDHRALIAVLKAHRATARMTQRELATRLRWAKTRYSSVESGERRLDVGEFKQIAIALGVSPLTMFRRWLRW